MQGHLTYLTNTSKKSSHQNALSRFIWRQWKKKKGPPYGQHRSQQRSQHKVLTQNEHDQVPLKHHDSEACQKYIHENMQTSTVVQKGYQIRLKMSGIYDCKCQLDIILYSGSRGLRFPVKMARNRDGASSFGLDGGTQFFAFLHK